MDETDEAFETWYRRLHPRLVTAVIAVVGDREVAIEACDEAFVRALERWARVGSLTSPDGWAYTVALNVARRRFRRRRMEAERLSPVDRAASIPGPAGELWLVVADLPERQRTAVVLRHVGQLTETEVAAVMGIRRGTVSSTLRTAYARLRVADVEFQGDPS